MGESPQGESPQTSDKHSQRLDDELVRDPSDEEYVPDPQLWDTPGHDGIVGPDETDPDRTDLRSQIGEYVSLVGFPAFARDLVAETEKADAPDEVLVQLRSLDPSAKFDNTAELWAALDLGSDRRF